MVDLFPFEGDKSISLNIVAESSSDSLIYINPVEALEYGEAPTQLKEGFSYEYKLAPGYQLKEIPGVVIPSKIQGSVSGRISTGIYTGTLIIDCSSVDSGKNVAKYKIEIRSRKTNYRSDYRMMLGEIADKCTDLLLQHSSPVVQNFEPNYALEPKSLYQKYAFLSSVIGNVDFIESVHRIINSPVAGWQYLPNSVDIRRTRRINNSIIRQITSATNRFSVEQSSPLYPRFNSLPTRIAVLEKYESIDIPENQFVKHVLTEYLIICSEVSSKLVSASREKRESENLTSILKNILEHPFFNEISPLQTIPLNSPVLQRKEGYREILRSWVMFDLASKLIWKGGDDVYEAGKRNVAVLYEYWVFFKLLDLVGSIFSIKPSSIEDLIKPTSDGLNLIIKSGKCTVIEGSYFLGPRKLDIEFSYNRTFAGEREYPQTGSWSKSMRPDYTLSIWPSGFSRESAEKQELLVNIHFDAKYRVESLGELFGTEFAPSEDEITIESEEQDKGIYRRADLLKMHAYRDAIRRTAGAYVIYPGTEKKIWQGFHELIPGLGAFPLRPSSSNDGAKAIKQFIIDVLNQLDNRSSQLEQASFHIYDIYREKPGKAVKDSLPEMDGEYRVKPLGEISVLVGFCKTDDHHQWVVKNKLYNFRIGSNRGSLKITPEAASAKYLLIHEKGKLCTGDIWEITERGPRIFPKSQMLKTKYPDPSGDFYLVYKIKPVPEGQFKGILWDVSKLENYKPAMGSAEPFAVTLVELMQTRVKEST